MKQLFAIMALFIIGCSDYDANDLTSNDIVWQSKFDRIFYHEGGVYSVVIEDGNHKLLFKYLAPPVTIFIDTERGNSLIEYRREYRAGIKVVCRTDVFLKSVNIIEGGGWNHGKYGQGSTIPLN